MKVVILPSETMSIVCDSLFRSCIGVVFSFCDLLNQIMIINVTNNKPHHNQKVLISYIDLCQFLKTKASKHKRLPSSYQHKNQYNNDNQKNKSPDSSTNCCDWHSRLFHPCLLIIIAFRWCRCGKWYIV